MTLNIHEDINTKLNFFISTKKIPNIIFHGQSGSGKRTIVNKFISNIYDNNKVYIRSYVLKANCAHGKGIKFIRNELKFFAKTRINFKSSHKFKTIILSNADKLTIDAQSALRRCIELFSHSTRFFIIVENKEKLLTPILSRFCDIFIQAPPINLHKHNLLKCFGKNNTETLTLNYIKKKIKQLQIITHNTLINLVEELYEKSCSGLDLINCVEKNTEIIPKDKYIMLVYFDKIKKDFRNEKLFMLFILNTIFIRSNTCFKNMLLM